MLFRVLGSTYNINVTKERKVTRLHGEGWEQFVQQNNLTCREVLLVFTMAGPNPRISVAYMDYGNNVEESDEESEEESDSFDSDSFDYNSDSSVASDEGASSYIVAQRVHLKKDEQGHLDELLPIEAYIGVPFVTRLTTTNLKRHEMVYMPRSFPS